MGTHQDSELLKDLNSKAIQTDSSPLQTQQNIKKYYAIYFRV